MYVQTYPHITRMILCDCDAYQIKDLIGLARATTCSTIDSLILPIECYQSTTTLSLHYQYSGLGLLLRKNFGKLNGLVLHVNKSLKAYRM